ncbi:BLUF domain-containing protein [Salipiger bermudensis]|uniref:BLUF domain-containing protein n=1 Tax=Salipiger bermudensis TaxID=344736 RepID=UPI001CD5A246|nr:BLUF domain-containing protein [Salipiger bermudensis]MCA0962162.1 BLUF domain-containing protein [Salipiger bermudensis]
MITQMLYTSLSRHPRGHSSDYDILEHAMQNNRSAGVTGYLLRDTDRFCQLLEGAQGVLDALYDRIHRDPRHHQIVLRMKRTVRERGFLGWSMGYGSLSAEDSAILARSFAGPPKGILLAFNRVSRIASVAG